MKALPMTAMTSALATLARRSAPALALIAALSALPATAQQTLIPAQSQVQFTARQMGVALQGQFKRFDAQVRFDPAKPQDSQITLTIDTASATMGARETDAELPKANWFHVAQFPQAQFVSRSVKPLGQGRWEVAGALTIKGAAQNVTVPVQLVQNKDVTTASGEITIQRLAFKIGDKEWADTSMVANDVQVRFSLALSGVGKL